MFDNPRKVGHKLLEDPLGLLVSLLCFQQSTLHDQQNAKVAVTLGQAMAIKRNSRELVDQFFKVRLRLMKSSLCLGPIVQVGLQIGQVRIAAG